jgi:CheY-like chemotaxis protein
MKSRTMKFPLYHRPSALIFLDDEISYLEMLAIVMPKDWCISLHARIHGYMERVHAHSKLWEEDVSQHQEMVNQWYKGEPLPPQILNYWRKQPQRYSLSSIGVVDYAMPAATGLDVLKMSPPWPPFRVMLTGKADEHIAVRAFNEGLIDRYVTKQSPDLVQQLITILRQHYNAPMDFHEGSWRSALRKSQQLCLQDREVQSALQNWLKEHACIEYVILPEPFGMLALDVTGHAHWLQFEMYKDLAAAVDLATAAGHDAATIEAISKGLALSNAEWQQAMREQGPLTSAPAMIWGTGGHLVAAHFELSALGKMGLSHREFLSSLPERVVDDEPAP